MSERICPWWLGYALINPIRKWFNDPHAMLAPFVNEGMRVMEPGPGMGYFTLELARLVGTSGKVFAVDLQKRMLDGVRKRAAKVGLLDRIDLREAKPDDLSVSDLAGTIDFVPAIYMVHEIPHKEIFLGQIRNALRAGGKLWIVEPKGHVKEHDFTETLSIAEKAGFSLESRQTLRSGYAAVLIRN